MEWIEMEMEENRKREFRDSSGKIPKGVANWAPGNERYCFFVLLPPRRLYKARGIG